MSTSLPSTQRWLTIRTQFGIDALLVFASVWAAAAIRFHDAWPDAISRYLPALGLASLTLPSMVYIFGLYSPQGLHLRKRERMLLLCVAFAISLIMLLIMGSLNFTSRVGRGVLALQVPIGLSLLLIHHSLLVRRSLSYRRRLAVILRSERDVLALRVLGEVKPPLTEVAGYFSSEPVPAADGFSYLGDFSRLHDVMESERIDAVLCADEHLRHPDLANSLRRVCFSGHPVLGLTDVLEEAYGAVPLALVDMEWLIHASAMPRRGYARKLKRFMDVLWSCFFGLLLSPALLIGMLLVRLTSSGPIFYRQVRSGRYGRTFDVWKLRTMTQDAEKSGAQWAAGRQDSRLTPVGGFLRTFRIDEIPQLWNILVGDMSFVGPRPERPEFVEMLSNEIPYYEERLLVQPGLTGWAQVSYPYGASVQDARRKLEFDLYYMKHMSLMLDVFILLDTVRTILRGGAAQRGAEALRQIEAMAHPVQDKTLVEEGDLPRDLKLA